MADIVLFTPKAELDAAENLRGFISVCRDQLTIFGAELNFGEDAWDITEAIALKARGNKRERLVFSTHTTVKNSSPSMMCDEFRSFAKAYMRYMHGMRPTKSVGSRLAALRALEHAMQENGNVVDITRLDAQIFNRAAQIIKEYFTPAVAFRVGGQLEMVAELLTQNRLASVPIHWRNFLKRPRDSQLIGKEFDDRRQEKMPSRGVLEAIPKAFRLAVETPDVLITSILALLLAAPDRINEVLLLPTECEVEQNFGHDKKQAYGLRWWPAKGAEPMVKLITSTMVEVVKEAVTKIRQCTIQARVVAKWYEQNPSKIFLSENLHYLRGQTYINLEELRAILWGENGSVASARNWCKEKSIRVGSQNTGKINQVSLTEIEGQIIAMLPSNFPWLNKEIGLKYSDALFIIFKNELHETRGTYSCIFEGMSIDKCYERLGKSSKHGKKSVFDRLGLFADDNTSLEVTTHQFRHYLNTIAQAGQMSDIDIAKWSGRKDIQQNATYDHTTPEQRVAKLREVIGDSSQMFGPLAEIPKYIPIKRDEFARLVIPTAHTTDFGFCIHDYTMLPCQLHMDCINCQEQVCVKGDEQKMERAKLRLSEARLLLERAEAAKLNGYYGVDRWLDHHKTTLEHLSQLCGLYDDPLVQNGAVIQLSIPNMPSRLHQAVEDRAALENNDTDNLALLRNLMNDI